MKKNLFTAIILGIAMVSCEISTYDEVSDTEVPTEKITYTKHVKGIMEAKCTSCHSTGGSASSRPLNTYAQVNGSINQIIDRIQRPAGDPLRMPQGGTMSAADISIIVKWKEDGLLQN